MRLPPSACSKTPCCCRKRAVSLSCWNQSRPAWRALISQRLEIPTIGIGAGAGCDGQVLVSHDVLGLFDRFTPKFVKKYADLHGEITRAFTSYKTEVKSRTFPAEEHTVEMPDEEWEALLSRIAESKQEIDQEA